MPSTKQADKVPANKQQGKKVCPCCGKEKKITQFYLSYSPMFSLDQRIPICTECCKQSSLNEDGSVNLDKLKEILLRTDKPLYYDLLDSAKKNVKKENSFISDEEVELHGYDILSSYFRLIAMRQNRAKSFSESEKEGFMCTNNNKTSDEKMKIKSQYIYSDEIKVENNIQEVKWSEQDLKNRKYAIEVIGYDPFDGYPEVSKKFLFNSLSPYLEDDDNVDDAYKLSQILQIIENNMQIRVCDKKIANLDPLKNAPDIKTLSGIKNQLVQSNDKIAKENEISVKNRSNKDAGKSSLTYLMRDLREKDFDKAEADYYDQLKSPGSQWAISISQKAMLDHCIFDENDKKEVYETQFQLINDLYKELDDKKEEIRLLLIKVDELTAKIKDSDSNGIS